MRAKALRCSPKHRKNTRSSAVSGAISSLAFAVWRPQLSLARMARSYRWSHQEEMGEQNMVVRPVCPGTSRLLRNMRLNVFHAGL